MKTGFMNKKFSAVVLAVLMAAALSGCFNEPADTTVTETISIPDRTAATESSLSTSVGPSLEPVAAPVVDSPEVEYANNASEASIFGPGGFSIPTDGEYFSNDELLELAKKRYAATVGRMTEFVDIERVSGDIVYIRFYKTYYDSGTTFTYTEDVYKIDRKTGVGTDKNGMTIDLTAFI